MHREFNSGRGSSARSNHLTVKNSLTAWAIEYSFPIHVSEKFPSHIFSLLVVLSKRVIPPANKIWLNYQKRWMCMTVIPSGWTNIAIRASANYWKNLNLSKSLNLRTKDNSRKRRFLYLKNQNFSEGHVRIKIKNWIDWWGSLRGQRSDL